jgi:hypothetical protein
METSSLTDNTRHHLSCGLPLQDPTTAVTEIFVLDQRGVADIGQSHFYFLQGERRGWIKAMIEGDLSILSILPGYEGMDLNRLPEATKASVRGKLKVRGEELKWKYEQNVDRLALELADFVRDKSVEEPTHIAAVPSSRAHLLEPYLREIRARFPSAAEIGLRRSEGWGSNSCLSVDERVRALRLEAEFSGDNSGAMHVLVVDDVLASGESAAAVIHFLQQNLSPAPSKFTVAAALRILS